MSTLLAACLLLTVAAVWLGVLGAARLRDPLDRLHAVTFVNIAGGAAVTAAAQAPPIASSIGWVSSSAWTQEVPCSGRRSHTWPKPTAATPRAVKSARYWA